MPFRLRNLEIDRVDLVDAGANPEAHVLLFKRAQDEANSQTHMEVAEVATSNSDQVTDEIKKQIDELESANAEAAARAATAEEQVASLTEQLAQLNTELEGFRASDGGNAEVVDEELVLKSLPAEVRERLEKAERANIESAERIAKMERENAHREFVAKARDEYANIGDAESLATLLLEVRESASAETFESLAQLLKSADARIAEGSLFKSYGTTREFSKRDVFDAEVKKYTDTGLSRSAAVARVLNESPEFYTAYSSTKF